MGDTFTKVSPMFLDDLSRTAEASVKPGGEPLGSPPGGVKRAAVRVQRANSVERVSRITVTRIWPG